MEVAITKLAAFYLNRESWVNNFWASGLSSAAFWKCVWLFAADLDPYKYGVASSITEENDSWLRPGWEALERPGGGGRGKQWTGQELYWVIGFLSASVNSVRSVMYRDFCFGLLSWSLMMQGAQHFTTTPSLTLASKEKRKQEFQLLYSASTRN